MIKDQHSFSETRRIDVVILKDDLFLQYLVFRVKGTNMKC